MECPSEWQQPELAAQFDTIRSLRSVVYKVLSSAREAGSLRSFTEAQVGVVTNSVDLYNLLKRLCESSRADSGNYTLSDILIVSRSSVEFGDSVSGGECREGVSTVHSEEGEVAWRGERCRVGVAVWRAEEKGRHKCPRCWLWTADNRDQLCQRCTRVHTQTED